MSKSWSGGSTRRWRKTRLRVLRRDQWTCQLRIPGRCLTAADCVHHTLGKTHGDDPTHLVAACTPCNRHVGDPAKQVDPKPLPWTL
jgi:5-methylcytosine-specific restriction endonuclease McrA